MATSMIESVCIIQGPGRVSAPRTRMFSVRSSRSGGRAEPTSACGAAEAPGATVAVGSGVGVCDAVGGAVGSGAGRVRVGAVVRVAAGRNVGDGGAGVCEAVSVATSRVSVAARTVARAVGRSVTVAGWPPQPAALKISSTGISKTRIRPPLLITNTHRYAIARPALSLCLGQRTADCECILCQIGSVNKSSSRQGGGVIRTEWRRPASKRREGLST
jgi:hypothetical protein